MPNQVTISVPRVGQILGDLYGKEVEQEFESYLQSKNLGREVTVYQGDVGDGVVSIRYRYSVEGQAMTGLLRFDDSGLVNAGEGGWYTSAERQGEVWKSINSVLISLAFGVRELSLQPPDRAPDAVLEGAVRMYRAANDGSRRDVLNQKTDHLVASVGRIDDVCQKEDQGPFGWDCDEIEEAMERYLPLVQSYNRGTLSGSRLAHEEAQKLLTAVLGTSEGREACRDHTKQCTEKSTPAPACRAGETPVSGSILFFEGTKISSSEGYCAEKEKPEKRDFTGKW